MLGALWLAVVLSAIGIEFGIRSGTLVSRAINVADRASATAAARGCIRYATDVLQQRLRRSQQSSAHGTRALLDPWAEPGRLLENSISIGTSRCAVSLKDAGTRLHLNRASEDELRRLLVALRIDARQANAVAQGALDWRDPDGFARVDGAERAEYVDEGRVVLPRNGSFRFVDELLDVRGVTLELSERVGPLLTVEGSGRVNLNAAPPEVLQAVLGASPELLAAVLDERRRGGHAGDLLSIVGRLSAQEQARLRPVLAELRSRVTNGTVEVVVEVTAWAPGTAVRVEGLAVVVRVGGSAVLAGAGIR